MSHFQERESQYYRDLQTGGWGTACSSARWCRRKDSSACCEPFGMVPPNKIQGGLGLRLTRRDGSCTICVTGAPEGNQSLAEHRSVPEKGLSPGTGQLPMGPQRTRGKKRVAPNTQRMGSAHCCSTEMGLNMALSSHTCSVRQLNEMQTDPAEERKETLPCFFQLYPGPRSATPSLLHCSILSHKTQRERECDKDESDVAGSYVKTITLQLSVIDFPNQRCIQLPTNRYQQGADAGEFSIHTSGLAKEHAMLWGRLGAPTLLTRTALTPIISAALTMKVELTSPPGALPLSSDRAAHHCGICGILPSPTHSSAMGKGRTGSTMEVLR